MGLEIQGAVNSMLGSVANIQAQNNETKRKAASIVIGALTGGVGGAAMAAAREAGVNTKPIQQMQEVNQPKSENTIKREELAQWDLDKRYSAMQAEKNKAAESKSKAINHMKQAQEEKRNRVPIYGARGEVING